MQGGYKGNDYPGLTEKSSFEDMQAFFRNQDDKDRAAIQRRICGPAALPAPCAPGARVQVSKSEQAPGNTFKQGDKALWPELFEGVRKTEQPVVILVLSRRTGFSARQAIRQTWAKGHDNIFFVVGASCPIPLKDRVNAPYGACLRQFVSPADRQTAWDKEEQAGKNPARLAMGSDLTDRIMIRSVKIRSILSELTAKGGNGKRTKA